MPACENRGDPVEQTNAIFSKYRYGKYLFHVYDSLTSETEAPVGTIGNTLSSLPTITSSR